MAGTKVAYPNVNTGDVAYRNAYQFNALGIMDEDEIVQHLKDPSFDKRVDTLEQLRAASRRNGGRLPLVNSEAIFESLAHTVTDSNWHVRNQCIQLVHELIPQLGDDLDPCLSYIIHRLVGCVGDINVSVRRAGIQTLHVYMKHTNDVQPIFRAIIQHGLDHNDARVRKEVTIALPMLCTPEFSRENFYEITQALAKRLVEASSGEHGIQSHALLSMERIRKLVGESTFNGYVHRLSPPLRRYYFKLTDQQEKGDGQTKEESARHSSSHQSNFSNNVKNYEAYSRQNSPKASRSRGGYAPSQTQDLQFGVVPMHIMEKLQDQGNFRTRAQAVEELKLTIKDQNSLISLSSHLSSFIDFLTVLLDDSNFKITTVTLEILGLLVEKLNAEIKPYLKPMVAALSKRMGDNKIVVRQAIMKVVMQLMQILSPKAVLSGICENLSHRNSRVRQETLNIAIASLLTFPSYDFDLGELCQTIAHTLVDPKRQVRQASLECFASLAQAMGPGKLQPLVQAVDSVELSYEGDGVMAAVQARLARRQLPKLNADGLVDYAMPIPSSTNRNNMPVGADVDWILSAAGGTGTSARSTRSDMELESVTSSSARSTPVHFVGESPSHGPTPRRISSGKGKSRLPWDEPGDGAQVNGGAMIKEGGSKTQSTWPGDDGVGDLGNAGRRAPRTSRNAFGSAGSRNDDSPEQGSYRHIHLSKYKKQSSDTNPASFSTYNNSSGRDNDDGWSYPNSLASTPRNTTSEVPLRPNFSQSWPDAQMFEEAGKPNKRHFLDPIAGMESTYNHDWPDTASDDKRVKPDTSPVPTKPTLARGASSKKKVPPIMPDYRSKVSPADDEYKDSWRDSALDSALDVDDEMSVALRGIRNSANNKKKASLTVSRSPSPPERMLDSGVSTMRSQPDSPALRKKSNSKKPGDLPFESKPRLARKSSMQSPKTESALGQIPPDQRASLVAESVAQIDFRPVGGVTFRPNTNSDVAIVGKGYSDDSQPSEPKPSMYASKAKDRRSRVPPKAMLSPLAMSSPYQPGPLEMEDDRFPGGVFGKGMFDGGAANNGSSTNSDNNALSAGITGTNPPTQRVRRTSRSEADSPGASPATQKLPRGVYGVGVKQNSLDEPGEGDVSDDEDVGSMAPTTKEKLRKKQEEFTKRKEDEQREFEQREEELQREKTRQQDRLRRLSSTANYDIEGLSISGNAQQQQQQTQPTPTAPPAKTTVNKPSSVKRRPQPPQTSPAAPDKTPADGDVSSSQDLKPFKDPNKALDEAHKMIAQEQWNVKTTGLDHIRRLTLHHPEVLSPPAVMHQLNLALIAEVKNLRSQVSRSAIVVLGELYANNRKATEADLDHTVKALLAKYAETNSFIREELDRSLNAMVENAIPQRAMVALIAGGASSKNAAVRKATAQLLVPVVEKLGPGRALSGIKDVTDKLLPTAGSLIMDANSEIRYNAQKIFLMLMSHDDFDRMLSKHVSAGNLRSVQDRLDTLKRKGLVEPTSEASSARNRRSGRERSNNSTRENSASSGTSDNNNSPPKPQRRSAAVRTDDFTMETITSFCQQMKANNWQERQLGITGMEKFAESKPVPFANNLTKIFDCYIPCLKDSNSKTNLHALNTMLELVPSLPDSVFSVLNLVVQTLSSNLSSKNKEIYMAASSCLDTLTDHIECQHLIQPMVQQAQSGSALIKPDMIERVSILTNRLLVQGQKMKTIRMHVLPLLWQLLGTVPTSGTLQGQSGNTRTALGHLANNLYHHMGEDLYKAAKDNSKVTPRMIQFLEDLIKYPERG